MKHEYRRTPISLIDVPEDRVRAIKTDRVQVLSFDIAANGQLQPVGLVEEEDGRHTLVFGAHRLFAVKMAGVDEIDARVTDRRTVKPQELRVWEIMENLDREGLTALERAESLSALKVLHEELYPEAKNGGDRKSKAAKKRKNQNEIFSFSHEAAERTGLSRRAIEIAVAMVNALDAGVKSRVRGTWLEDHQAGLRQLSTQDGEAQHRICDLLFASPPEAANVTEAIALAEGRRLPTASERLFANVLDKLPRLTDRDRRAVFDAYEAEIRAYAKEKGWL